MQRALSFIALVILLGAALSSQLYYQEFGISFLAYASFGDIFTLFTTFHPILLLGVVITVLSTFMFKIKSQSASYWHFEDNRIRLKGKGFFKYLIPTIQAISSILAFALYYFLPWDIPFIFGVGLYSSILTLMWLLFNATAWMIDARTIKISEFRFEVYVWMVMVYFSMMLTTSFLTSHTILKGEDEREWSLHYRHEEIDFMTGYDGLRYIGTVDDYAFLWDSRHNKTIVLPSRCLVSVQKIHEEGD